MAPLSLVLLFGTGTFLLGAMMLIRKSDQKQRDRQRKNYVLSFPHELDLDRVVAWVDAIPSHSNAWGLIGAPAMTLETWADTNSVEYRLRVPWQQAEYVIPQLRTLVPGMNVYAEEPRQ